MGDPSKSQTPNFHSILGIPKSASLSDICKTYKALVMKWHPDRNPSNKAEAEAKFSSINEAYRALSIKKREEANACNEDHEQKTHKKKKSADYEKDKDSDDDNDGQELKISSPKLLSRTTSRISPLPSPTFSSSLSRRSTTPPPMDFYASFPKTSSGGNTPTTPSTPKEPTSLTKVSSRRCTTPIFFSQSVVRRKPPPVEKKLECTLEELCHGCVKKIKITRDAISSSGLIVQEEEILMIKVKPGWKKGTKITFEGKGDERPGTLPADIIFSIDEKRHPMFKREGDDLALGVEVPLVQALTGCTIPVPLLGGGQITLSIDDIIYPGYEKIIPGQGMPTSKDGKRGDLKLKFLVEFPTELSDDQRSEVVSILQECS
ncbi:Molecular chaperone (DnaJ superfamily) [Handroanthus impetiginosus]|uniref:Molecular chaperone (DnaJ superfamily) n=1 Tax=Handroanthus impetiginosus TaxID=429701 RepID=A0A2G9HLL7_9LAMI|nr:Molecular chaperone (DnaJ superfamily) [Handroanthus impetiginosus]